jgi:hypothetical protein
VEGVGSAEIGCPHCGQVVEPSSKALKEQLGHCISKNLILTVNMKILNDVIWDANITINSMYYIL